jgi:hypothetical protein
VKGYLSDSVYYLENPFTVSQGVTTTSSSLVTDGSTAPLHVELLSIKNLLTGVAVDSMFLKPDTIRIYKDAVTSSDSTLTLLNAKLKDSAVAPFSINNTGGRLQFTQATKYVTAGSYSIDISISNSRGSRVISNACEIDVISTIEDSLFYKGYSYVDSTGNNWSYPSASALKITIARQEAGANKIIFIWKDKNGTIFNPSKGEVVPRNARPSFTDWDPFYTAVKTDTSIEYQYPAGVPQFPVFSTCFNYPSFGTGIMYYQIPWKYTDIGLNVNPVSTIMYYSTKGTYYVTFVLSDIAHK